MAVALVGVVVRVEVAEENKSSTVFKLVFLFVVLLLCADDVGGGGGDEDSIYLESKQITLSNKKIESTFRIKIKKIKSALSIIKK